MLRWISTLGGLLIMMGHHSRSEALFYYFRVEDQVPENHLLRGWRAFCVANPEHELLRRAWLAETIQGLTKIELRSNKEARGV